LAWSALGLLLVMTVLAPRAEALVRFDFEQKYYRHPGRQVWDFSIIRPDSIYHIYYHTIHEQTPSAARADTIWHATSPDLKHWSAPDPILTVGQGSWDEGAMWAPDVFRDEANNRWGLAYTGCDANLNQTICMAFSDDLMQWAKADSNPAAEADTNLYIWDKQGSWSDFRDPFVYRKDDRWHLLVTAKQDLGGNTGVLYHGTSSNLETWTDVGPLFINDGIEPWRVPESPQYHVIGTTHHLLFGEFDTIGTSLLSAPDPAEWTMADRVLLDAGYAPEVDEFDPGVRIFSRLANFLLPNDSGIGYVVRMDTLLTDADGGNPTVSRPHPLDANWIVHSGTVNLATPTFGDNPIWRGEPSVGLVGNSYFGSQEYHQGPLSGRGAPGTKLGPATTGVAETYRFPVTGNRMNLLVGGGDYPTTCYVALVDDADDSILLSETGGGSDPMTPRQWDLTPFQGRMCYVTIVDQETGPGGYINVDEIIEVIDVSAVSDSDAPLHPLRHGAWPNPFNPRTTISFDLSQAGPCEVRIFDLRGRLIWRSGALAGRAGANTVTWTGTDDQAAPVAAGTYLYAIEVSGQVRASAKLALVK
jgi:predicted GH43/DUF377 family glycosyl hydrolase